MKHIAYYALMLAATCFSGCHSSAPVYLPVIDEHPSITNMQVGAWVNTHSNTPGLIGINVEQFPDCTCKMSSAPYAGAHPAWIFFLFQSNMVNVVNYNPDGSIISEVWTNIPDTGKNWVWNDPDVIHFNNGEVHNNRIHGIGEELAEP